MTISISGRKISRISLIDDEDQVREAYSYPVEELGMESVLEDGPIHDMSDFVRGIRERTDAAICDHHLRQRALRDGGVYSRYDGAELVTELYRSDFPAILCTRYRDRIEELRRHRRFVPVLLHPDELSPDAIARGLEVCVQELSGNISANRRPWRSLVRVADVDNSISEENPFVEFVVPAWDPNTVVRISKSELPDGFLEQIGPQMRCHAKVNLGAENHDDLYVYDWEAR